MSDDTQLTSLDWEEAPSFEGILNILPMVRVQENNGVISIGGFSSGKLVADIQKYWKTARLANNIFIEMNFRSITFNSFFAVEVLYMLGALKKGRSQTSKGVLSTIIAELMKETWLSNLTTKNKYPLNYKALKQLTVSMLPSQMDFLDNYAKSVARYGLKGNMLAAPPGTGKTLSGFGLSLALEAEVTVFVVPKNSLHEVWEDTINTRFKEQQDYWISSDKKDPKPGHKYYICHYESLGRLARIAKQFANEKVYVHVDESHNFNEVSSTRTQILMQFCKDAKADAVVWASGTPLKAIGSEVVPFLTTIDPLFTDDVKTRFVKIFGATTGRALDILANRIGATSFKVPKKDVVNVEVTEYPRKITMPNASDYTVSAVTVEIRAYVTERTEYYRGRAEEIHRSFNEYLDIYQAQITNKRELDGCLLYRQYADQMNRNFSPRDNLEEMRYCKQIERNFIYPSLSNADRKDFKFLASRYKYITLVIRGEALGRILTRRRIDCFKDMIPQSGLVEISKAAIKKTLIFTSYVEVAKEASAFLNKEGIGNLVVYGETNKDLSGIIKRFTQDHTIQCIVATFPSLSTAVPVLAASSVVLLNEPWRDGLRYQSISRAARLGQDTPVSVYPIILDTGKETNLSTRMGDILAFTKATVDAIMGTEGVDLADGDVDTVPMAFRA